MAGAVELADNTRTKKRPRVEELESDIEDTEDTEDTEDDSDELEVTKENDERDLQFFFGLRNGGN